MTSIGKDDDLRSFDVPEIARHSGGYTIYKIVLQITPKELTENTYQVCIYFNSNRLVLNTKMINIKYEKYFFFPSSSIGNVILIFESYTTSFTVIIKLFIVQGNFQVFLINQDIWVLIYIYKINLLYLNKNIFRTF